VDVENSTGRPVESPGDRLFRTLVEPAVAEPPETRLRRFIIERGLRPGDRLPGEHDLARAAGGSRVVVRRALHALEAVGLIESRVGSGWYVRAFDVSTASRALGRALAFHPSAVLDLLAVWRPIEAELARTFVARLDTSDLAALEALAGEIQRLAARGRPWWREDSRFHRRFVAATGNLLALTLVDLHWNIKAGLYEAGFPIQEPEDAPAVARAHLDVARALRDRDGERAARLLSAHHEEAERRFRSWLASHPEGDADEGAYRAALQAALLLPASG
jgi:DNA-binding FadR family transcriptional regulator